MQYFTTLPNEIVKNKGMSFKARGMLLLVFSNCDEWRTSNEWFEGQATEGKEAIRSGMKELESLGHVQIEIKKGPDGVPQRIAFWHMRPVDETKRTNQTKWRSGNSGIPEMREPGFVGNPSTNHNHSLNQEKVLNQEKTSRHPSETSDFKLEDPTPKTKAKSYVNEFSKRWSEEYRNIVGMEYQYGGAKDAVPISKNIQSEKDMFSALNVATQAWSYFKANGEKIAFNSKRAATIRGFFSARNDIEFELMHSRPNPQTPPPKSSSDQYGGWTPPTGV